MRIGLLASALLLSALPARGDDVSPSAEQIQLFMALDAPPAVASLDLDHLKVIANQESIDSWVGIRAISALADFCAPALTQACTSDVHTVLSNLVLAAGPVGPASGVPVLRLRAAVEALGVARIVTAPDVDALTKLLQQSPSRDVRATVARTLGTICNLPPATRVEVTDTLTKLKDPIDQVRIEVFAAVQALVQCTDD
jgi:hypothetical protein